MADSVIACPEIIVSESLEWEALEESFREAPAIKFGQYWLENMEPGFASGRVRMGWKEDRFLFFCGAAGP